MDLTKLKVFGIIVFSAIMITCGAIIAGVF